MSKHPGTVSPVGRRKRAKGSDGGIAKARKGENANQDESSTTGAGTRDTETWRSGKAPESEGTGEEESAWRIGLF